MNVLLRLTRRPIDRLRRQAVEALRDLRGADGLRVTFGVLVMVGSAAVVAPFTPLGVPVVVKPLLGIWGAFGILAGAGILVGEMGRVRRERRLRAWRDERATERLRAELKAESPRRSDPGSGATVDGEHRHV